MKTTTITREYDEQGRLTREIRTEVETPDPKPYVDDGQWWRTPKPWWQNPVISFTATSDTSQVLINATRDAEFLAG